MCGILSVLRYNDFSCKNAKWIEDNFKKYPERGPEQSVFMKTTVGEQINYLGFHRLAINGYNNSNSMQPICKENCTLICNGEIYNWKTLAKNIHNLLLLL